MQSTTNPKQVEIAALLGFDEHPVSPQVNDPRWLLENSAAGYYALRLEDLPLGGWANQGMCEAAVLVKVDTDSHEYSSAVNNSAI